YSGTEINGMLAKVPPDSDIKLWLCSYRRIRYQESVASAIYPGSWAIHYTPTLPV
ncbi:hypothetical protein O988_06190, partial [Pseudogymnoascus sp. VKM F-3808]